jgi:ketosteroid isomerase-like protein
MSHEGIEVVRRSFAAWNANDWPALEAAYDPDVIVDPPEGWPEGEIAHGWEAVRVQFERVKDAWQDERVEVDKVEEVGDRVLAQFRWVGRGKGSGVDVAEPLWALFRVRDARIVRLKYFLSQSNAVSAAKSPDL